MGVAFIVGSLVTPKLARRVRPAYLMAGGLLLSTAGSPCCRRWGRRRASPLRDVDVHLLVRLLAGLHPDDRPDHWVRAARARRRCVGDLRDVGEFGGALGIALFGSIGVAVYRTMVADVVPPGLSPEVVEATKATLGGAMATAAQLPAELGAALTDAARVAFIRGLRVCAVISAVGSFGLAVFAALALRRARPGSERADADAQSPVSAPA